MKRLLPLVAAALVGMAVCVSTFVLSSCKDKNAEDSAALLLAERDSFKAKSDSATARLQAVETTMSTINATLDSLALEEDIVFVNSEGQSASRADALRNLDRFEAIVRKQREHINQLEAQLKAKPSTANANLERLVTHMKEQLAAKDVQIAQLRADLKNKNVSITQLRSRVKSQNQKIKEHEEVIAELDQRNAAQAEALTKQDEIINYGYVIIASKRDLKSWGFLKRGKLVSEAIANTPGISRVDIRKWREITFTARRPRVLTSMPASSYELTEGDDDNYTLRIKDPNAFWSISNYLVIQTN